MNLCRKQMIMRDNMTFDNSLTWSCFCINQKNHLDPHFSDASSQDEEIVRIVWGESWRYLNKNKENENE